MGNRAEPLHWISLLYVEDASLRHRGFTVGDESTERLYSENDRNPKGPYRSLRKTYSRGSEGQNIRRS